MRFISVLIVIGVMFNSTASGQNQVTVTAPATTVSESFSERIGVGFSISHPNISIGIRGPSPSGFGGGGFSPFHDGLSVGIPLRGGRVNANLSIDAAQGFSRSMTTTAPTITVPNGVPGFVASGTVEPFVTGLFPIVGAGLPAFGPPPVSRVRSLLDSGQIELKKDSAGNSKLIINELPTRRKRIEPDPEPPRSNSDSSNSFRRALEKYAGPKR